MRFRVLRLIVLILALGAFLGAGASVSWSLSGGAPHAAMTMDLAHGHMPADPGPQPCKAMFPGCMTDLGCVLMIGLTADAAPFAVAYLSWSPVRYAEARRGTHGLTHKPALGPPILHG